MSELKDTGSDISMFKTKTGFENIWVFTVLSKTRPTSYALWAEHCGCREDLNDYPFEEEIQTFAKQHPLLG